MAVTWDYNASSSTNIDMNLTDFEGSADANGFSLYIPTRMSFNQATNSTTVTYGYMLHERTNNFSTYSCTTYLQYKIGTAAYVKSYNPATTIQYTAMTTSRYYWMGNNDGTPAIAFTSIPTSGTLASPTGTFSWTFTVNHDANGTAPAVLVNAYMDSNTNASYVPVGTTATGTLTTLLNSATYNLNYRAPYFITNPQVSVSRPTSSTIRAAISTAAVTNTASNNVLTYHYNLYIDDTLVSSTSTNGAGAQAEGALYTFPDVSVVANASHDVYVTATDAVGSAGTSGASSTITSYGTPTVGTVSATEQDAQSRNVDLVWSLPVPNGLNQVTSQTVSWSTSPTFATTLGSTTFASSTQTTYTISGTTSPSSGSSVLDPSTTYYWRVSATNAVGTTTSSIASFTTRASSPFISPSANTAPNTRSSTKVWNGTAMVQAKVMVYDGTSWKYLK